MQLHEINEARKEIDPGQFDEIGVYYVGSADEGAMADEINQGLPLEVQEKLQAACPVDSDRIACWHCGTAHAWGAAFHNKIDNEIVLIGGNCASTFFQFSSRGEAKIAQLKRAAATREKNAKIRREVEAWLETKPELKAAFEARDESNPIVRNIYFSLMRYGSISHKQQDLALKLHREYLDRLNNPVEEKPASQFVGAVKERLRGLEVTLAFIAKFKRPSFSGYGEDTVFIYGMRDDQNNLFIWKTATGTLGIDKDSGCLYFCEKGDRLVIDATVKEHTVYRDENQTQLSRVKVKAVTNKDINE